VRLGGAPNERLALLFRDWFRAHPEAVPSYARFKQVLADRVADADADPEVKDPVVDLVVAVAESWATATGWTPSDAGAPAASLGRRRRGTRYRRGRGT
jgi:hypothetical protein